MTNNNTTIIKALALPAVLVPNAMYLIGDPATTEFTAYVVDKTGSSVRSLASTGGGGGGADTSPVISKLNSGLFTMTLGQPVYSTGSGSVALATSSDLATKEIVGLVSSDSISKQGNGLIQLGGLLIGSLSQWETVTENIGGLVPGKTYFIDTATGRLTYNPGNSGSTYICAVGQAVTNLEFFIRLDRPIVL